MTKRILKIEYANLIRVAKNRNRDVDGEIHHILPKSIGGSNVMKAYHFDNCPLVTGKKHKPHYKQTTVTCPHCGKQGKTTIMGRWHFDKCKYKDHNEKVNS